MSPVQSIPPPTVTNATPSISNNLNTTTKYITSLRSPHKTMSDALSISNITQKQMAYDTSTTTGSNTHQQQQQGGAVSVSVDQNAVAAVAAAYQYNYNHLYSERAVAAAALYGAPPIIFSAPTHPGLTVAAPTIAYANYKFNGATDTVFSSAYLNAIQNAVKAGMFSPSSQIPPPTPAIPAPTLTPPTPTLPKSPNMQVTASASASSSPPSTGSLTGTYLNEKAFNAKTSTNSEPNYFKVPSGKEGSMKHRILTRPLTSHHNQSFVTQPSLFNNNEEMRQKGVMKTYETTSNFRKGSYIELANGVLRKVEDMRTEDFIQCAERSTDHKLTESTVVKIDLTTSNTVIITFSYDNNRSKADIEVSYDHPFFVYGQGWASYNPEASAKVFGLRCQRLQVGDICISLTKRDDTPTHNETMKMSVNNATPTSSSTSSSSAAINMTISAATPPLQDTTSNNMRFTMPPEYTSGVLPLSPHTPPAGLVPTSNNHINLPPPPPTLAAAHYAAASHNLPFHLMPAHLSAHTYAPEMADLVSAYAYHAHLNSTNSTAAPPRTYYHPPPPSTHGYYSESQTSKKAKDEFKNPYHLPPPLPPPATDSHYHHHHHHQQQQQQHQHHSHMHSQHMQQLSQSSVEDEPFDATTSRKRRWSAPEGVTAEDEQKRQSTVAALNGENGLYKIYKPAAVVAAAPPILGKSQN